jgi:Stress responsive A/B Barrel Domain
MIAHVILFAPRPDLDPAQRVEILESFRTAATAASVRSMRIGRRVRHGLPGYESAMRDDFEYFAVLEFDDLEGLKAYLQNPAHDAAGRHFSTRAAAALAYDYTVVNPDELAELFSDAKNE